MPTEITPKDRLEVLADIFAEGLVVLGESGQLGLDSFVGEAARKALIPGGNEGIRSCGVSGSADDGEMRGGRDGV